MERILAAAAASGARSAYVLLRLPHELKDLFREWLDHNEPLKAKHVMSRLQAMRGGRDNDARFGVRQRGEGEYAQLWRSALLQRARGSGSTSASASLTR